MQAIDPQTAPIAIASTSWPPASASRPVRSARSTATRATPPIALIDTVVSTVTESNHRSAPMTRKIDFTAVPRAGDGAAAGNGRRTKAIAATQASTTSAPTAAVGPDTATTATTRSCAPIAAPPYDAASHASNVAALVARAASPLSAPIIAG